MSTGVIISLVIAMLLLFVTMVLSALSNADLKKGDQTNAQKYSLWSAITSGLSIVLLIVVLVLYIYSADIVKGAHGALGKMM